MTELAFLILGGLQIAQIYLSYKNGVFVGSVNARLKNLETQLSFIQGKK